MDKSRILVVDDESVVTLDVSARLQNLGYTVAAVASSGEEAVERAKETRPDLVLMDIRMPGGMDGIEAADLIREQFDIPVVFVTAYGDAKTVERATASGPFGYILKPFDEKDLNVTIEVALYKHKIDWDLRQRVRELTALNQMFQKHLAERFAVVEAYGELRTSLRSVAQEINALMEQCESRCLPDLHKISGLAEGESVTPADE